MGSRTVDHTARLCVLRTEYPVCQYTLLLTWHGMPSQPLCLSQGREGPAGPASPPNPRRLQPGMGAAGIHCFACHQFLTSWVSSDGACWWEGQEGLASSKQPRQRAAAAYRTRAGRGPRVSVDFSDEMLRRRAAANED